MQDAIEFVSGVSDERIVELYAEAEIAVVPSLYEGFSLPAVEAMACGVPLVTTTGGALPEVVGPPARARCSCRPPIPARSPRRSSTVLERRRACAGSSADGGRRRVLDRFTWRKTAEGTAEHYYLELEAHARRAATPGCAELLTVDFDRLGLVRGERLLDLGAGGGRHTVRRRCGAARGVTALDYSAADLKDVAAVAGAMLAGGEVTDDAWAGVVNGDALELPVRRRHVRPHRRVGGARAHLGRRARASPRSCACCARAAASRRPSRRAGPNGCRGRSTGDYHDTPGGHVRIYRQHELEQKLERAGLFLRGSHHAHALHSPYWWLKCAYGLENTEAAPVKRYHDFLVRADRAQPALGARVPNGRSTPSSARASSSTARRSPPTMARWGKRSLD